MPSRLPHIGTYRRELPVSLERLYENAIDWEHLPYLHRTTFSRIESIDAGNWGFRARVWGQPYEETRAFVLELKLDRDCRRWITSTLEGPGAGTEIWTHAFSLAPRTTMVVVDFFVPGVKEDDVSRLSKFYKDLYAHLYDEDVWMMTLRESELDRLRAGKTSTGSQVLGQPDDVRKRLPLVIEMNGSRFKIIELDGKLEAFAATCPHLLGPLDQGRIENGIVECPWHGYRFDLRTHKCVSGATCHLAPTPEISIDQSGQVTLKLN